MITQIDVPREKLAQYCRGRPIRRLALFGSVLRDDFRQDSDIDMLVEFEEGATVGLLEMAQMEIELSELLGRKVDLRTPAELSRYFRQRVLDSAEPVYVRG